MSRFELFSSPPRLQIPSSAVEMPGSADVSGLNVQFGALDFGSEAAGGLVDVAQKESSRDPTLAPAALPISHPHPVPVAAAQQQPQSSLFSKPGSIRYPSPPCIEMHNIHRNNKIFADLGIKLHNFFFLNLSHKYIQYKDRID